MKLLKITIPTVFNLFSTIIYLIRNWRANGCMINFNLVWDHFAARKPLGLKEREGKENWEIGGI